MLFQIVNFSEQIVDMHIQKKKKKKKRKKKKIRIFSFKCLHYEPFQKYKKNMNGSIYSVASDKKKFTLN